MAGFDLDACLAPISDDAPAGEDLAYDAGYGAVFQLAKGRAETQWSPGEEPNWREVRDGCEGLLRRTKDLPAAVLLALSLLKTNGLAGLADGLELIDGLLTRYWDTVYPRVDPDDGDATERVNAVTALSPPAGTFNDPYAFREAARNAPLATSSRVGRFTLHDVLVATGKAPPPGEGKAPAADDRMITAAFDDTPDEALAAVNAAADRAAAATRAIEQVLTDRVGDGRGANLADLRQTLIEAANLTRGHLAKRGLGRAPAAAPAAVGEDAGVPAAPAPATVRPATDAPPGEIASPADVTAALDRICKYYARAEPSSPVPMLLLRARRLVGKSFAEVVRDLSPDALSGLSVISGTDLTADPTTDGSA